MIVMKSKSNENAGVQNSLGKSSRGLNDFMFGIWADMAQSEGNYEIPTPNLNLRYHVQIRAVLVFLCSILV
jgi:hypothetical protein